jgi:hypothetical protein
LGRGFGSLIRHQSQEAENFRALFFLRLNELLAPPALAFATHELGASNLPGGYVRANQSATPLGMEIALVTENVAEAHAGAIDAGAMSIKEPL